MSLFPNLVWWYFCYCQQIPERKNYPNQQWIDLTSIVSLIYRIPLCHRALLLSKNYLKQWVTHSFDSGPETSPCCPKYSAEHQMWINPPQRRIPSQCIISSCLSDYIIQPLQEVTETDIKDYISVRLKSYFHISAYFGEGILCSTETTGDFWLNSTAWHVPESWFWPWTQNNSSHNVRLISGVSSKDQVAQFSENFRCWDFVFINVGTINQNIIDIVIWVRY